MKYDPCANTTECQPFTPSHMSCAEYINDRDGAAIIIGTIIFSCIVTFTIVAVAVTCKKDMDGGSICGMYLCIWIIIYIPMILVLNHVEETSHWPAEFCRWVTIIFFIACGIAVAAIVSWKIMMFLHKHFSNYWRRCFGYTSSPLHYGNGNLYSSV